MIIDQAPDRSYESGGLPFTAKLTFVPVLGQALWQVTPDAAIKDGLGVAFAPGYDVPDRFVDDFNRMTYDSYHDAPDAEYDYTDAIRSTAGSREAAGRCWRSSAPKTRSTTRGRRSTHTAGSQTR